MSKNRGCGRVVASSIGLLISLPGTSSAALVSGYDIFSVGNMVDTRQSNTANVGVGTFNSFWIDVSPTPGTTVVATQGSVSRNVPYLNSPALPLEFFRGIPLDTSLTGAWNLGLTNPGVNGGVTVSVPTRTLFSTTPPPFVTDVTLSGGGLTPSIAWQRPAGYTPSSQSIFILDKTNRTPTGASTLIFTQNVSATANSFTIPTNVLQQGAQYTFAVQLDERHTTTTPLASTLTGRSRSFVDFTTLPPNFQGKVVLPVVGQDLNPNDNLGAPYEFNVAVIAGVPVLIDPTFATGYRYQIGAGDPLIASVALPDIGDPSFDLYLWNGSDYVFNRTLAPNERWSFGLSGVDRFEILGIDPNLGLDPTNPLAFITELTFLQSGRFTGTQTPITTDVNIAAVSEPGSFALLGLGLLAIRIARRCTLSASRVSGRDA